MVLYQRKLLLFKGSRGVPTFARGGGGGEGNFFQVGGGGPNANFYINPYNL